MTTRYVCLSTVLLAFLFSGHLCVAEDDCQKYYQRMDDALTQRDPTAMFGLLAELDSVDIWSFGAGLGPTDAKSLQMRAVQVFSEYLLDSQGRMVAAEAIKNTASGEKALHWIQLFQTDPNDSRELARLLKNDNPAVRWLALKKASFLGQNGAIIDTVRDIVESDPYVQISRQPTTPIQSRPSPPGMTANAVVFPLRMFACQLLSKWGDACKLDNTSNARDGIQALARMWEQAPNRRSSIQEAIKLLNPKGPCVAAVKELGENAAPSSAFAAFYREVHK